MANSTILYYSFETFNETIHTRVDISIKFDCQIESINITQATLQSLLAKLIEFNAQTALYLAITNCSVKCI